MKNTFYEKMYKESYLKGLSLEETAKIHGISRQSVWDGFNRRGYKMRSKKNLTPILFDGIKFTPYQQGYLRRTDGDRELMHRYVWRHFNGKIPKNMEIHHINHKRDDNRIENLAIYTKEEHAKLFATGRNQHNKNDRKNKRTTRP